MLKGIANAFHIKELRGKILLTLGILFLYRIGSHIPVPGIPLAGMLAAYKNAASNASFISVLDLFSGGALSRVSLFSLGIMPYITAEIIMQMMQTVVPSLSELAKEGESGQRKITQYNRYITIVLAFISAVGYLFLFKSPAFGINFANSGAPELIQGTVRASDKGLLYAALTVLVIAIVIPFIVYIERGQRRIPIQYAKRVVGRRIMGGQSTYLPIKVNTAGVVPIIFASAILYFPAQIAVFFPGVAWIKNMANAVSAGWINWTLSVLLIVFFAYFYTSMVFNPEETADNLKKQGGFIPGVRPGAATAAYIKSTLDHITLPGAIFMALIAVVPSIAFTFTSNALIRTFGGTSILIMVGVAMDTISQLEAQLKMHNYEGFFK